MPARQRKQTTDEAIAADDASKLGADSAASQEKQQKQKQEKQQKRKGWTWSDIGTNLFMLAMFAYAVVVGRNIYGIFEPDFPKTYPNGQPMPKFKNQIEPGTMLHARMWAGPTVPTTANRKPPAGTPPDWEFDFPYGYAHGFEAQSTNVAVSIPEGLLSRRSNVHIYTEITRVSAAKDYEKTQAIASAKGEFVKYTKPPVLVPKYSLLSGEVCEEHVEKTYGKRGQVPRGLPQLQIRLVYDEMRYPQYYLGSSRDYYPKLLIDEFWMSDDQLIKLNNTGNAFDAEVSFDLMSSGRWRFQRQMEQSFKMNEELFGEDSEEMLQMRDLFANTHPYLLTATMIVSFLHIIFEFLAFKSDVAFFSATSTENLNTYISIQSIVVGIFCQLILMLYLWDEEANLLVLATSLCAIVVDVWKVQRAMSIQVYLAFGFVPWISLTTRGGAKSGMNEYDKVATKYLSYGGLPIVGCYAVYTLVYDCHKGWYSYVLYSFATIVYALGFALMTPQLFINYKLKSVAFLPWRKFIYRALNTFIDDLFSFIVRMPTMHRMSCFRDDIVFLIYLYQRYIYPEDKTRMFDEDDDSGTASEFISTPNPAAADTPKKTQ